MSIVVSEVRRLRIELPHSAEVRTLPVPAMQTVEHHFPMQGWLPGCRALQLRLVIAQELSGQVPHFAERMPVAVRPGPFLPVTAAVAAASELVAVAVAIVADHLRDC